METNNPGSLKNKFENFGVKPTDGLWHTIENNLTEEKKKRGVFWWWFAGIAAGISILILTYNLGYQAAKNNNNSANNISQKEKTEEIPFENNLTHQTDENSTELLNQKSPLNDKINSDVNGINEIENLVVNKKNLNTDLPLNHKNSITNETPGITNDHEFIDESKDKKEHLTTNKLSEKTQPSDKTDFTKQVSYPTNDLTEIVQKPYNSKWEMSIGYNYSNPLFNSKSNYLVADNESFADLSSGESLVDNSGTLEAYNSVQPAYGTIKRPLNFQFLISYHFNNRLYLSSGLGFNYFNVSTYSSISNSETKSNYMSIAIPIYFGVKFINRKHFESAFETGCQYEMPFFYNDKKENSLTSFSSNSKGYIQGNMFAFNSGLTFAYKTKNQFKIGLNIGIIHYLYQSVKTYSPIPEQNSWWTTGVRLSKAF